MKRPLRRVAVVFAALAGLGCGLLPELGGLSGAIGSDASTDGSSGDVTSDANDGGRDAGLACVLIPPPGFGPNVVTDGDFTNGCAGWGGSGTATPDPVANTPPSACKLETTSYGPVRHVSIGTASEANVQMCVRACDGDAALPSFIFANGGTTIQVNPAYTTTYRLVQIPVSAPGPVVSVGAQFTPDAAGCLLVDDLAVYTKP